MPDRPRVLFSPPWFPDGYQSQAWDNPVTDFGDLQFTGHQELFSLHGHTHELFAHVIAPNLRAERTRPEREAVDEAARLVATFAMPIE